MLLQGLRLELEGIRSQLYNQENALDFDDAVSQLMHGTSRLRRLKEGQKFGVCVMKQFIPASSSAQQTQTQNQNGNKKH